MKPSPSRRRGRLLAGVSSLLVGLVAAAALGVGAAGTVDAGRTTAVISTNPDSGTVTLKGVTWR